MKWSGRGIHSLPRLGLASRLRPVPRYLLIWIFQRDTSGEFGESMIPVIRVRGAPCGISLQVVSRPVSRVKFTTSGQSTSIEGQVISPSEIQIYPNPTQGAFHIATDLSVSSYSVEIYDVNGKRVFQSENLTSDSRIDWLANSTTEIVPGFYMVAIKAGERGIVHRPLILVQ